MPEYSRHQKKIIDRYYDHRDTIMLDKLSELVGELYLAETDKKRDKLWERVALAMKNLKIKEPLLTHNLTSKRPELLAQHLQEWSGKK
jgi:hypothetical protein